MEKRTYTLELTDFEVGFLYGSLGVMETTHPDRADMIKAIRDNLKYQLFSNEKMDNNIN